MTAISSGIFQPTTLTMLSGLTILVAATLALGSMAQDQSGHSTAMVARSFRTEMGARENEVELIAIDQNTSPVSVTMGSPLPGTLVLSFGELKDKVHPAQKFASLLSELERISGHCVISAPVREVRIDVLDADSEFVISLIEEVSDMLNDADLLSSRDSMPLEIQTWAASPTQAEWIDAVLEASRLRGEIDRRLSATGSRPYKTASSAALWPHATRARPAITIVFQVPVH